MMHKNNNVTELITLMRNKNEFIQYITRQFAKNRFNKPFEAIIWAIHFNIPKYQRLLLLNSIIQQSVSYYSTHYGFLQNAQIIGKAYESLGIPTICGTPDKCFLKTYKMYTSYYPIIYPQNKKTHSNVSDNSFDSLETNLIDLKYRQDNLAPTLNIQSISNSTQVKPLLNPVATITKNDSFLQNMSQNSSFHDENNQTLLSPTDSELSGVIDIFKHVFPDEQKIDVTEANYMSESQSGIHFISRNPKNSMDTNNDVSKSDEYDSNSTLSKKSFKRKTKHNSYHFNSSKKITTRTNKNLSKKIKTNFGLKHRKQSSQTRKTINMQKLKRVKQETTSRSKLNNDELWERIKPICSDSSISNLERTSSTTKQFRTNEIEHNSIKLGLNDKWKKYIENLSTSHMDIECQITKNKKSLSSSVNSFSINNSINHKELDKCVQNSSFKFGDINLLQVNLTDDSHKLLDSFSKEFTWSSDSIDENNDEQSTNHNILKHVINNNSFENTSSI